METIVKIGTVRVLSKYIYVLSLKSFLFFTAFFLINLIFFTKEVHQTVRYLRHTKNDRIYFSNHIKFLHMTHVVTITSDSMSAQFNQDTFL